MSDPSAYKRALDAALREYETLAAEHTRTGERLAQLKQMIATLTKLCGYEPTVPLGLTDACRLVLRNAGQPMTAMEIRDRLEAMGLDLGRYSNALAAVHTVLKRLQQSGEIAERDRPGGVSTKTAYSFTLGPLVASHVPSAPRRGRRATGEGLCPPGYRNRKKKR